MALIIRERSPERLRPYTNANGLEQGFIATPVPEPATLTTFALAGLALLGLMLRKRKLQGSTSN